MIQTSDGMAAGLGAAFGALLIKLADKAAERWLTRPDRVKALEESLWQRASETITRMEVRITALEAKVAEQAGELDNRHAEIEALRDLACEVSACEERQRVKAKVT